MQTKQDYVRFVKAFNAFFERECVTHMSSAVPVCGECKKETECGACPECGKEPVIEPYFSWQRCGCCDTTMGGDREDYVAFNMNVDPKDENRNLEVSVCADCVYFNEYGRLDDASMDAIDKDERPATVNGRKGTLVGPVDGQKMVFKDENNELSPVYIDQFDTEIEFPA